MSNNKLENNMIKVRFMNGEYIVSMSGLLPSDINDAEKAILKYEEVLNNISCEARGALKVKETENSVTVFVDNIEYMHIIYNKITGWIVGSSSALPRKTTLAITVVNGMRLAINRFILEKNKNEEKELFFVMYKDGEETKLAAQSLSFNSFKEAENFSKDISKDMHPFVVKKVNQ